jgi:hypothetical protein
MVEGLLHIRPSAGRDGIDTGVVQRDRRAEPQGGAVDGGVVDDMDEVRLGDGTSLVVRPIRPDDATALVALHARLSADTIYRRYIGVRPRFSPADVVRFTHVDGRARSLQSSIRLDGRFDEKTNRLDEFLDLVSPPPR